jgi:hypothetical protein
MRRARLSRVESFVRLRGLLLVESELIVRIRVKAVYCLGQAEDLGILHYGLYTKV